MRREHANVSEMTPTDDSPTSILTSHAPYTYVSTGSIPELSPGGSSRADDDEDGPDYEEVGVDDDPRDADQLRTPTLGDVHTNMFDSKRLTPSDLRDMTIMDDTMETELEEEMHDDDDDAPRQTTTTTHHHDTRHVIRKTTIHHAHSESDDDDDDEAMFPPKSFLPSTCGLTFHVNRASVTRTGLIPCCVFVGRVTWGTIDWEIYFGQKQLVRLHLSVLAYLLYQKRRVLPREISLPWTIWREKRAEKRITDVDAVQNYIRSLLADEDVRDSDPLLSFLEVSPSRAMSRYGPSLKEGYVHMRMNGAFQLPLYSCVNRTIEGMYRHLYKTWMRIAFISVVVTFILPTALLIVTTLPRFFSRSKNILSDDGVEPDVNGYEIAFGVLLLLFIIYVVVFVYKFFNHRLGVIRRWVVLKPTCFAAYRRRGDCEPSEVFLFDKSFTARKGSYRQGLSWMPSGFVVGSEAGFIEVDTGHYYTRLTMSLSLGLICWAIMAISARMYDFETVGFTSGSRLAVTSIPDFKPWTTSSLVRNTTTPPPPNVYCGFYFTVPSNVSLHVRSDQAGVGISQAQDPSTNTTVFPTIGYYLGSDEAGYNMGILANKFGPGSIVAVTKKLDLTNDAFRRTEYNVTLPEIGLLTLKGLSGGSLNQSSQDTPLSVNLRPTPYLCEIPIQIAVFGWSTVTYYLLLLLGGGIVAAVTGLALNYLISYVGLWHAHVRRDHWYRCVQRLQKLKRQETEYRYRSFAPERVSVAGFDASLACSTTNTTQSTSIHSLNPPLSVRTKATSEGSMQSMPSFIAATPAPSSIAWHVDGEDTYEAMYKAISDAKYEILIAGWWVTPDLYLLRPGRKLPPRTSDDTEQKQNETQLRTLLLKKAQEGVKIYVLLYKEVKLALTLNSEYTRSQLKQHPNIRVLRDPLFQIQSLGFWSHHEKIVCIDQALAFVGGLDLCFGRYDHSGHPLSDPGNPNKLEDQTWPGKDYSNPIIKDFVDVNKPFEDLIDRTQQPRMPWHDVHCSVSGPPVQDIAYHFIQRWNFVCSKNDYQLRTGWCICARSFKFKKLPKCLIPMDFSGWTLRYPSSDVATTAAARANRNMTVALVRDESMELGYEEPFEVVQIPLSGSGVGAACSPTLANWGSASALHTSPSPGSGESTRSELSPECKRASLCGGAKSGRMRNLRLPSTINLLHPNANVCNVQVVRSVSMWSAGVPTESSIQTAYIDIISKAKHFIYIENQFFISGLHYNGVVSNRILQALVDRIERAVKEKEAFRVYVVMPLLPAFEGNIRSEELTNLHAVMHWQFATISRGRHSLFAALAKFTDAPDNYVSFFGLRKYGILPNGLVSTEQIYIHSKLLIADDQYAIIGSANINDRSMNGDRDSEIALVIEDVHFEDGLMNERPYRRGIVAGALRKQLFREHLGLAEDDGTTLDPTAEWSWRRIRNIATRNTQIFESVFDCAPSNRMTSFGSFHNIEITQIFENQRMNVLKAPGGHVWDAANLKEGDYAPWTDVNGVPINMDKINLDDFVVDQRKDKHRKHFFSMDHDGWCYARNFSVFQEVRVTKSESLRKRVFQHFRTDRLMAQVRRRRLVKKGSPMMTAIMSRHSSFSESDDEGDHGTGRFHSLWRRLHRSDSSSTLSRANSFSIGRSSLVYNNKQGAPMMAFMGGGGGGGDPHASYPNSPTISHFRPPPSSPEVDGRDSSAITRNSQLSHLRGSNPRMSAHVGGQANAMPVMPRDSDRDSGGGGGLLRRWYSLMDGPIGGERRSRFTEEYFSRDKDDDEMSQSQNEEALLESGRPSVHSTRSVDTGATGPLDDTGAGECQIGHVQTAATVRREDESRARGQLSEIHGHLVEFPLNFLADEILKPSILPRDIHI